MRAREKMVEKKRAVGKSAMTMDSLRAWGKRLLSAGLIVGILAGVALTLGMGYQATANVASIEEVTRGKMLYGYVYTGNVYASFNVFLYPISYLSGDGNISGTFAEYYPVVVRLAFGGRRYIWFVSEWSNCFHEVAVLASKNVIQKVVFSQFLLNLPYFFAIGFIVVSGLEKLLEALKENQPA